MKEKLGEGQVFLVCVSNEPSQLYSVRLVV